MAFEHISVLLGETIEGLHIRPGGVYVDGTLGGGGHAGEIARRLGEGGRLIGIDQDEAAVCAAQEHLREFGDKVAIVRDNYQNTKEALSLLGISKIDGMLLDLGVSSYQLDTRERGFSYRFDTPLDMRMDRRQSLTARDIVNNYQERALFHIIRDYGEDKFAKNIARHIVMAREKKPIETTGELNEAIRAAIPAKVRAAGGHPSKRTFQAIRIECNRELDVLKESLGGLIDLLTPGGRLCVITFHSLEDRIVKTAFRQAANPCTCPPDFPVCVCGKTPRVKLVGRRPITAGEEELKENPRARSAKLRLAEKL